jgi:hypothetical protein
MGARESVIVKRKPLKELCVLNICGGGYGAGLKRHDNDKNQGRIMMGGGED